MTTRAFPDPDLQADECIRYRGLIKDQQIGAGTWRVQVTPAQYTIIVEADAGMAGFMGQGRVSIVVDRVDGVLKPASYVQDGRIIGEHGSSQGHDEGKLAGVNVLQWVGDVGPYPDDMLPALVAPLALRGLLKKRERIDFPLWLVSMFYLPVHAKVEGVEDIPALAGRSHAWRVRFRPNLKPIVGPLDRLIQPFIPPFVGYFEADEPHRFLRFEFPTGPFPWNPPGAVEAIEEGPISQ